jgi:crotonobetainyl-CoA:carnitine CoA-transferase CaiB-like acyl-CoA transferase
MGRVNVAGALAGIRVVEFASYVSGPYAGMMLADLGAEVVKVEAVRAIPSAAGGASNTVRHSAPSIATRRASSST